VLAHLGLAFKLVLSVLFALWIILAVREAIGRRRIRAQPMRASAIAP
jgi:hypothetical protein